MGTDEGTGLEEGGADGGGGWCRLWLWLWL
jgi:hypothetical protein